MRALHFLAYAPSEAIVPPPSDEFLGGGNCWVEDGEFAAAPWACSSDVSDVCVESALSRPRLEGTNRDILKFR